MHNGLIIYQTKRPPFLALPCKANTIFNRPVVGKTRLLSQKSQQTHYYYIIATNLAKACHYLLLSFQ